jgi:hypothetical protein
LKKIHTLNIVICFALKSIRPILFQFINPSNAQDHFFLNNLLILIEQFYFDNIELVIFGDFNVNINNKLESDSLLSLMNKYGLKNTIGYDLSSTNYNTQIDLCFNTLNLTLKLKAGYFENLYSYHKPIWIMLNTDDNVKDFTNIKHTYPLKESNNKRVNSFNNQNEVKKLKTSYLKDNCYFFKLSNIALSNSCYANAVLQLFLSCGTTLFNKVRFPIL